MARPRNRGQTRRARSKELADVVLLYAALLVIIGKEDA